MAKRGRFLYKKTKKTKKQESWDQPNFLLIIKIDFFIDTIFNQERLDFKEEKKKEKKFEKKRKRSYYNDDNARHYSDNTTCDDDTI